MPRGGLVSLSPLDFVALENAEVAAFTDFYRAAPAEVRTAYAIDVTDVAGAICFTSAGLDPPAVFRRVVRLGVGHPVTEAELDKACAYMAARTPGYAITVSAHSQPPELESWLQRRGFTRGWAWMKFARPCNDLPKTETRLEVRVVDASLGDVFGCVIAEAFGMPSAASPWMAALAGRTGWVCVMAFSGGTPVAAGAAYISGDHAWLGFGATLEAHRRLGAQNALLARRLQEATARGARVAVTETGERVPHRPGNSHRNILRAGFREMYVRQNCLSPLKR
jgi:GNAT superfamily N-acetyltransferase